MGEFLVFLLKAQELGKWNRDKFIPGKYPKTGVYEIYSKIPCIPQAKLLLSRNDFNLDKPNNDGPTALWNASF